MEEKWKIIKEWVKLPPLQQLLIVLAVIIITLGSVIVAFNNDRKELIRDNRRTIDSLNHRHSIVVANIQTKLDLCIEGHIKYVEQNEKEYKEIVFSIDKIKRNQQQIKQNLK